jgi:hypothetical protein
MPPQPASQYAEEGTFLHACMERVLADESCPELTDEQAAKIEFCMSALNEIDPDNKLVFAQEKQVEFEGVKGLEGVFGNVDLIGRLDARAMIVDWKFGDGVIVDAEENDQGLFYAAAATKTAGLEWVFEGATEVEIIIVQPFAVRRWVTTFARLQGFTRDLQAAVKIAGKDDAPLAIGDWCRWCAAKPICPQMTGAIDRVVHTKFEMISTDDLARAMQLADKLESFIIDARRLAQARLERNMAVPGYKLVAKRAIRQWVDESKAEAALLNAGLTPTQFFKQEIISPAQAEKLLKKSKQALPDEIVVAVSSGSTLAPEDDPRPAVLNIGTQLVAALSKLQ